MHAILLLKLILCGYANGINMALWAPEDNLGYLNKRLNPGIALSPLSHLGPQHTGVYLSKSCLLWKINLFWILGLPSPGASSNYESSCERRDGDERLSGAQTYFNSWGLRITPCPLRCGEAVPNTWPHGLLSPGTGCHHGVPYGDYGDIPLP